jgi:trans-aconitate 2-methyltransferase
VSSWNPERYLRYADERSRPFHELLARVAAEEPRRVVDLGCGSGGLTAGLAERWPSAEVAGVDSSPEMIDAAAAYAGARVRFELGDIATWRPADHVDVIVANAALQWIPGHRDLLPGLVDALTDGGWLAIQVPGNFDGPSHVLLHTLAADPRFAAATLGAQRPAAHDAATYLADLSALGCTVDAWETTYLHVLQGEDPVFGWISGTGARPILQALSDDRRDEFEREYKPMLRDAYPGQRHGTVLPFRRVFAVARKVA